MSEVDRVVRDRVQGHPIPAVELLIAALRDILGHELEKTGHLLAAGIWDPVPTAIAQKALAAIALGETDASPLDVALLTGRSKVG